MFYIPVKLMMPLSSMVVSTSLKKNNTINNERCKSENCIASE